MKRSRFAFITSGVGVILLIMLASCLPKFDPPVATSGDADFSRVVIIGGTWLSGYSDGALWADGQQFSVGNLLAGQFVQAEPSLAFSQPLLNDPTGLGLSTKEPAFQGRGLLGDKTDCEGTVSLSVLRESFDAAVAGSMLDPIGGSLPYNMAVPYASTADLMDPDFGSSVADGNHNPFYHRFASNPGASTVISDAQSLDASFFVYWPGFEDIFNHAIYGGTRNSIPDIVTFRDNADTIIARLSANGALGVLATIPDFEHMPFFTTVPTYSVEITTEGLKDTLNDRFAAVDTIQWELGLNGFYIEDSTLDVPASLQFRQLLEDEYMLLNVPLDSVKCAAVGVATIPMPDRYYLNVYQIETLRMATESYNAAIKELGVKYSIPVADVNLLLDEVHAGLRIDGADFTTEFASGNFYSVEGQNPTPKGAALVANEFITVINEFYSANVPSLEVSRYNGVLFP